ncbi:FAD-dependent monooxygenase [Microlunatus aurantiacus]|uniref:FAD-dependent monooxygenase n=1 Tax=Microlunatus aurantiacus TaxID=446786 RepID=A0ABP7CIH9_9ACTN
MAPGGDPGATTSANPSHAVIIGASMAGLCAAAALAQQGLTVTVLERDRLSTEPGHRRGVPQDTQAHVLLYRGITVLEQLLPGFRAELLAAGAVAYDSGRMPWLGEYGWLDTDLDGYEVVSATRPLMEAVTRRRVVALTGVRLRDGVTVTGLTPASPGWRVRIGNGTDGPEAAAETMSAADTMADGDEVVAADLVVDASGRSSRLDRWGVVAEPPAVEEVDARVGYASRLYRAHRQLPVRTGVMILADAGSGTAGLALPVEHGRWLVAAAGFGERRPPRDTAGFVRFLSGLRDPALADLVALLEPAGEVSIHRQTANRRRRWDRVADWPEGLLVVGDALCSLDPVYGQGITVAAQQACALGEAVRRGRPVDRRLQRRLVDLTATPWAIATTGDRRQPTCTSEPGPAERVSAGWVARLSRLAATGHPRATAALLAVNNLMAPPSSLLHPALLLAGARPSPTARLARPAVLDDLSRLRRQPPPADPAAA